MADNSDEEDTGNPINASSENPSDQTIPTQNTGAVNTRHESENLEVQHQYKGKKTWKAYFWEFLMLFLAVFAGFLADNQRERIGEHQSEKKFARRMLSDLHQDSLFFVSRIQLLEKRQKYHEQFLETMTNPAGVTDSAVNRGFIGILLLTQTSNDYTTATYNQMKTSGSLRYIENDFLTTSLQQYYDVLLVKTSRDAEGADKFFADYIIAYMTKHFRFQDFKQSNGSSQPIKLLNRSAESDQELINIMEVWAANCDTQLNLLRPAQKQMLELIKLIKIEYQLK